jgi:hypothetical protein
MLWRVDSERCFDPLNLLCYLLSAAAGEVLAAVGGNPAHETRRRHVPAGRFRLNEKADYSESDLGAEPAEPAYAVGDLIV